MEDLLENEENTFFTLKNGNKVLHKPGDYVRPLGYMEKCFGTLAKYDMTNTLIAVWIQGKKDIDRNDVKSAVVHLAKRHPNLQLCLGSRMGELWFRRVKKLPLNFEVYTNRNDMEVYHELLHQKFDVWKGPLWKIGLVYKTKDSVCNGKEDFEAAIMFSVPHVLTDGTTGIAWGQEIVEYLNALSKDQTVSLQPLPFAPPVDKALKEMSVLGHNLRYIGRRCSRTLFKKFYTKSSFNGAIEAPHIQKPTTKVIFNTVDKDTTSAFIAKCKENKLSVNSVMTCLANYTLLHLAQQRSNKPLGQQKIFVNHAMDIRRYYLPEYKKACGCHVSVFENYTAHSLEENFWTAAKRVNTTIKADVDNDVGLKILPLMPHFPITYLFGYVRTALNTDFGSDSHYFSSNLGNIGTIVPNPIPSDAYEINYVMRSTRTEHSAKPFLLNYQSLKGRFLISIDYATNSQRDEVINEYLLTLCNFITKVALGINLP